MRKHAVSFDAATTVFADPLALIVEDAQHADRALIIGESISGALLVVVFGEVHEDDVRIISARRATKHERRRYESNEAS